MTPALSEETRIETILSNGKCYDLHIINESCFICHHGTYDIILKMTKEEFYSRVC